MDHILFLLNIDVLTTMILLISRLVDWYAHLYFRVIGSIFPSMERLEVEITKGAFVSLGNSPRLTYTETKKLAQLSQPNRLWPLNQTSSALAIPHRVRPSKIRPKIQMRPKLLESCFSILPRKKSRWGLDFGNSSYNPQKKVGELLVQFRNNQFHLFPQCCISPSRAKS